MSAEVDSVNKKNLAGTARRRGSLWKRIMQYKVMYLFLLPAVVWYIMFMYAPIYGLQLAFRDYKINAGMHGSKWVGLQHFVKMFNDPYFYKAFTNTLVISGLKLVFVATSGLILALMLNELVSTRFRNMVQDISLLPHFFSWVVIASIMVEILSPSSGLVNEIIKMFGGKPIYFLGDKNWYLFWIIASDVWESAGWNSIIFIAAIAGIPPDLYESASIDGAGRLRKLVSITLPCISSTIVVVLVLKVGQVMNAGFEQLFNMNNSAVMDVGDILDTYVYRVGITNMKISYAAAVGLFKNVIALVLVWGTNHVSKRLGQEGIF